MHIVKLEASNVLRIRAVTIEPSGAVVVIGGRNGQGKTSTLAAIEMALGGGKSIPEMPVRTGARSARVVLDLGDIVVERTFSAKGTQLVVRNADGVEQRSPQGLLDALTNRIGFDPLEFARAKSAEQDRILKDALGLDLSDLDAQHADIYQRRTATNNELRSAKARLEATDVHADAPPAEESVAELAAELKRRQGEAAKSTDLAKQASEKETAVSKAEKVVSDTRIRIAELEKELGRLLGELDTARTVHEEARRAAENFTFDDPAEIETKLITVEETNRKVRENAARAELAKQADELREKSQLFTDALAELEEQKQARIAAAKFPVEGLGFDESGPTLNGIPLAQCAHSERLRVSVAIGLALNPKLKVLLIREGAWLDEDAMRLLATMAEDAGAQVWIERVGTGDPGAVIIEDGEVLGAAEAAQ
jgi:DNA repair exonuclease SbcCD ATPase subunit